MKRVLDGTQIISSYREHSIGAHAFNNVGAGREVVANDVTHWHAYLNRLLVGEQTQSLYFVLW